MIRNQKSNKNASLELSPFRNPGAVASESCGLLSLELTLRLIMDRFVSTAYKLQSGIIFHDLLLEVFFKNLLQNLESITWVAR